MKKYITLLALPLMMAFIMTSCGEEEEVPTENIWQILESRSDLSVLTGELENYNFKSTLESSGEYTLFAPSNTALNNLLTTLGIDDFSPIRDDIAQAVLSYHVLNQSLLSGAITAGTDLTTSQGEEISVISGSDGVVLSTGATSDAAIEEADIEATNGVIHVVNVVLVPPTIGALIVQTLGSVAQPILLSSNFTILSGAITKADTYASGASMPTILGTLIDDSKVYTVFAPVDAALTQGGVNVDTFTGEEWYGLIMNHVALGNYGPEATQTAMNQGTQITTLAQLTLTVLATDAPTNPSAGITSGIVIDSNGDTTPEAQIAVENAGVAGNGVVHALAGVLSPQ